MDKAREILKQEGLEEYLHDEFEYQIVRDGNDFPIVLPVGPKDKLRKLRQQKEELRKRSRQIVERFLAGEIDQEVFEEIYEATRV